MDNVFLWRCAGHERCFECVSIRIDEVFFTNDKIIPKYIFFGVFTTEKGFFKWMTILALKT